MSEKKTHAGRCQCGAVRYKATTDLDAMGDCNCSRCRRLGWVMQSLPATDFRLESGEDNLALFHFNTETIDHLFCKTCGVQSFARGTDGNGVETVMINVNCLDDVAMVDRTTIKHWDGANW